MDNSKTTKSIKQWIAPNERSQRALFQRTFSLFFFIFFRGDWFLGRINTRVCTKLFTQYQTVQKFDVATKPIFITWNKLKLSFLGDKGGSTSTLDGVYHCKIYLLYVIMLSLIFYTENIIQFSHWIKCRWIYIYILCS